jgi:hypothetical protein
MYNFVEGDTASILEVKCIDAFTSLPINMTGSTAKLKWVNRAKVTLLKNMTITDAINGVAQYNFGVGELEPPTMSFDVVITNSNNKTLTCREIVQINVRKRL